MNDKKYWVWLNMVFTNRIHRLWQLFNIFETAEELCYELMSKATNLSLTEIDMKNIRAYSLKNAESLISECAKKGIGITAYSEPEYPNQLRFISDPPPVLFYKGNIGCLSGTKTITSVGKRSASEYSIFACKRICSGLAREGFVIVSGFAVGIDITSHMAAASQGYPTACILGCGIDIDYPKENFKYRDPIIDSGGVFISEYPPGTRANRGSFPRRNRILSALGRAVIVFEGAADSGSLITANLAAEQGRDVFVLPPADIFSSNFSGNIRLLREGAIPLMSVEDITDFFKPGSNADNYIKSDAFAYIINNSSQLQRESAKPSHIIELIERKDITNISSLDDEEDEIIAAADSGITADAPEAAKKSQTTFDLSEVTEGLQRDIMALLLEEGKLHADVISTKLEADQTDILNELTELEMLGYVKQFPGRSFEII